MEDLTKAQMILLVLLLSFVTSIATGIITVSLLAQAPPVVTQTINRVVQQTVEKVVPAPGSNEKTTEVKTIIVKEEDLVIDAVEKNAKSIVRVKVAASADPQSETFFSIGLIVNKDGVIVTPKKDFQTFNKYSGTFSDGTVYPLNVVTSDEASGLIFLKAQKKDTDTFSFNPTVFGGEVKLGQSIIAISGEIKNTVIAGRVFDITSKEMKFPDPADSKKEITKTVVTQVKMDTPPRDGVFGSPIVNLSGEVVGVHFPGSETTADSYLGAFQVLEAVSKLPKS